MAKFELVSSFEPRGDQPEAIEKLVKGLEEGRRAQVLLGVTGSGKTFTMANVIARIGRPALVISHNKTLAAQLYGEFKEFFPGSAVAYFVSYYDYYQPEAYIPQKDIYIEKDASINEDLDRLRLAATSALMARQDVIIVASVSCIYGLGSPEDYQRMMVPVRVGDRVERDHLLLRFVEIQYTRNDVDFSRGTFRVRGDVVQVFPAYEQFAYEVQLSGDEVEHIRAVHPVTQKVLREEQNITIYPAKHFVAPDDRIEGACQGIERELVARLKQLREQGKLLEAQRLEVRTRYDLELLREIGYCPGVENYSRHLSGRAPGERPYTLIDYFPKDYLVFVDESHVTVPQVRGMYEGDHSRKLTLVEHGFRLPSALDNRPLRFAEWEACIDRAVFVSATPGPYELGLTGGEVVEQLIRPTGLVDPLIRVEPARGQVEHLAGEIPRRVERTERVLVTTLTKRLAEELSSYFREHGLRCHYLHSEIDTIERVEILRDLRLGKFDVLVGVNLLREGLDLPEVSLVAILDADKEGFLRSETSLIQTIGRTARNVNAEVILYADTVTDSMQRAMGETNRRRERQLAYNREHGITPETIRKEVRDGIEAEVSRGRYARDVVHEDEAAYVTSEYVRELEEEMYQAAGRLDFEEAAHHRDLILKLVPAKRKEYRLAEEAADAGFRRRGRSGRRLRPRR